MNFWESEAIRTVYQSEDNYHVMECNPKSDICIIFFSGNALYYPNTELDFAKTISKGNRYEWRNIANSRQIKEYAGKVIFMRDIYKCWYTNGINTYQNSIDKVIELIRDLTKGYKVITVGNSAGGYMAVLTAAKIEALYCFNFCGQYDIQEAVEKEIKSGKEVYLKDKLEYCNLVSLIKESNTNIYYFFPSECDIDILQYELVKEIKNVKTFAFKGKGHGKTMFSSCIPYILGRSSKDLDAIQGHFNNEIISKWRFVPIVVPWYWTIVIWCKEIVKILCRKAKNSIKFVFHKC